jgi:hypothetical protein
MLDILEFLADAVRGMTCTVVDMLTDLCDLLRSSRARWAAFLSVAVVVALFILIKEGLQ